MLELYKATTEKEKNDFCLSIGVLDKSTVDYAKFDLTLVRNTRDLTSFKVFTTKKGITLSDYFAIVEDFILKL